MKIALYIFLTLSIILLAALLELYSQKGRYQTYWTHNNQRAKKNSGPLYIALGDSTAQGIGAGSPQHGYVGYVSQYLSEQKGAQVRVINLSKTGATVRQLLDEQIPELKKIAVTEDTVITVSIGANNIGNFDRDLFKQQVNELMGVLPKQTLIADIPYFGGSRYNSYETRVNEANSILNQAARDHGFMLVALHDRMQKNTRPWMFAPDWFHPSGRGYKDNWAPAFIERLK